MTHATGSFFGSAGASRRSGSSGTSSGPVREPLRDAGIRSRENLVVSNREIRQLFDTIKELGDVVKRQSSKIENMAGKLEGACKEVSDMKEQLKTHDRQSNEKEDVRRGPVPKQLKVCVKFYYNCVEINLSLNVLKFVYKRQFGSFFLFKNIRISRLEWN